jgi:hypothetical protein
MKDIIETLTLTQVFLWYFRDNYLQLEDASSSSREGGQLGGASQVE